MTSRAKSWLVRITAVAVIGGGGYALYAYLSGNGEAAATFRHEAAKKMDVEKQISATGTVDPLITVNVGSQVTGRIQELAADYNSVVKKGQVIARIDPRLYRTDVDRALANLAVARASVLKAQASAREAKLQYERDRDLAAQKVVATATVQTRLATYKAAAAQVASSQASVKQAQAALSQSRTNLAYTTIVSPIDGVVVSRSVDVGQTVAASLQAPTLFVIAEDLRKMEVHTSVAESDVGQIKEGMTARFSVDAFPDESFAGVVKQVRFEAQTVQNVVTYDAVVRVDNPELKLRPGMTANVTFIIAASQGALAVPNAALRVRPPEGTVPPPGKGAPGKGAPGKAGPGLAGTGRAGQAGARAKDRRLVWVVQVDSSKKSNDKTLPRLAPVLFKPGISNGSVTVVSEVLRGSLKAGDPVLVGVQQAGKAAAAGAKASAKPSGGGRRGPPRLL